MPKHLTKKTEVTYFISQNHKLVEEKQATISINDRGFLFGDGVFETCRIINGKIYDFKSHYKRINNGLQALKISANIKNLEKESLELIEKNKITDGILRITISRGVGSLGYLPTYESESTIIIQTSSLRELPKTISIGISKIKKSKNFLTLQKTNNALPYIITKINAFKENLFDSIMFSENNFISETSSANIFWVKNKKIYTPSKACGILAGTIREKLLKISPKKIYQVKARINSLKNAEEIFLTNSAFFIIPVDNLVINGKKIKLEKNISLEFLKLLNHEKP